MVKRRGQSWQANFTHEGRRYRRQFADESAALRWESEAKHALSEGRSIPEAPVSNGGAVPTLDDLLDLTDKLYWSQQSDGEGSYRNAERVIGILGGTTKVTDVNTRRIDELVSKFKESGVSGGTINRRLSCLGRMLKAAHQRGWISAMPAIPRQREAVNRMRWYTRDEEFNVLLYFAENISMRRLIMVLADTGLRLSNALALTKANAADGHIHIGADQTKTGKPLNLPMTKRVQDIVESCDDPEGRLFPDLTVAKCDHLWSDCRKALKLGDDAVLHGWRHTFCSRLAQAGADTALIKELAGHSNVATTMRYAHLSPERRRQGINLLEVGENPEVGHTPPPRRTHNPLRLVGTDVPHDVPRVSSGVR